jgi:hypothetical protein
MKVNLRRRGCEGGEDMEMLQDHVQWQALVLTVLKTLFMLSEIWLAAWLVDNLVGQLVA